MKFEAAVTYQKTVTKTVFVHLLFKKNTIIIPS